MSKKTKGKKKRHILLKIFLVLILIAGAAAGYIYYKTNKNGGGMSGLLTTVLGQEDVPLEEVDPINILVLGTSQDMSDTIMVCQYNPKTQEVAMLSIPRDTYTGKNKANAQAYEKINSRYIASGVDGVKKYLNQMLDMDLEYYVVVDTKALVKIVDTLGGVYFDVPMDMEYEDSSQELYIDLKAGYQLIDGAKAEQLLRFRHNNDGSSYPIEYGDQDYGRTRTQREFIAATLKQTMKPSNIFKIGKIMDIINTYVDTNIDLDLAKKYIPHAVNFDTENIKSGLLPGHSELCNGVWIFLPHTNEMKQMVKDYFEIKEEPEEPEIPEDKVKAKVEILNGSESDAVLKTVTDKLKTAGYKVTKTSVTTKISRTAIISNSNNTETNNDEIKEILNGIGTISKSSDLTTADYKIIIGTDYK